MQVVPLIPYDLYDPFIRVYIGSEFLDIANRTPNSASIEIEKEGYPQNSLSPCDSVEDLILNISVSDNWKNTPPTKDNLCQIDSKCHNLPFVRNFNTELKSKDTFAPKNEVLSPRTPLSNKIGNGFNSIPRSLKLNRLQDYTDFKDSYLYPEEGKTDVLNKSKIETSIEGNESVSSGRVTLKSLKNRSRHAAKMAQKEGFFSPIETERETQTNSFFNRLLKTEELDGFSLPPNSCFETAFTSDSPRTRIIPQKSVDTIHFRGLKNLMRPKSIAVSSLIREEEANSCDEMDEFNWLTQNLEEPSSEDADSGLNRSLSEGNLITYAKALNSKMTGVSLTSLSKDTQGSIRCMKRSTTSKSSLAARVRDSIKRKKAKNSFGRLHKGSRNSSYDVSSCSDPDKIEESDTVSGADSTETDRDSATLKRFRTKSGGYANPALNLRANTPSSDTTSMRSDLSQFRNASGGFVNVGLRQSKNSLNDFLDGEGPGSMKFSPDSASCYSATFSSRSKSQSPSFYSIPPSEVSSPKSLRKVRSKSATPDACLSHSLASSSLYHSALSGLNQTVRSAASVPRPSSLPHFADHSRSMSPPEIPKRKPVVMLDSSILAGKTIL